VVENKAKILETWPIKHPTNTHNTHNAQLQSKNLKILHGQAPATYPDVSNVS